MGGGRRTVGVMKTERGNNWFCLIAFESNFLYINIKIVILFSLNIYWIIFLSI